VNQPPTRVLSEATQSKVAGSTMIAETSHNLIAGSMVHRFGSVTGIAAHSDFPFRFLPIFVIYFASG
jgi:hypothetical protein